MRHVIIACRIAIVAAVGVTSAAGPADALRFDWAPGTVCEVEQWNVRGEEQPEPGRFTLKITSGEGGLGIRFDEFHVMPLAQETATRRQTRESLGIALTEKAFRVDASGRFLEAEPVAQAQDRLAKHENRRTQGISMLARVAANDQSRLNAKARSEWQTLVGAWIGLIPDGADHTMEIEPGLPARVTVHAAKSCSIGGAGQCVTIEAQTTAERFAPWKRYRVELEATSMLPRQWTQQEVMTVSHDDGSTQEQVYHELRRHFACRAADSSVQ